jgi:hypothetical protein
VRAGRADGAPAILRCARCLSVVYAAQSNGRGAAWGAHESEAVAVAAPRSTDAGCAGGGGGNDGVGGAVEATTFYSYEASVVLSGRCTGVVSAAVQRAVAPAVAMLGSRKPKVLAAGARALARFAADEAGETGFFKLVEFQLAVVDAGGVPLLLRTLAAADAAAAENSAFVVRLLTEVENSVIWDAIAAARGIPPLIALLASRSIKHAVIALLNLSTGAENRATMASAGAIAPLVALLSSSAHVDAQEHAAATLGNMCAHMDEMPLLRAYPTSSRC